MGRTTDYTSQLAEEICYAVSSSSHGIKKLCKLNKHWPSHDTIYRWLAMEKEFSDLYARTKRHQIEVIIDEILEIADDTSNDSVISEEDGKLIIDHEHINRSRLKIDTRKWLAAKLCPRLYGDKNERITLKFPRNINANSLLPMSSEVFRALANQEITPEHARTVIGAIKDYSATIIISHLNSRLAKLENTANNHATIE